MAHKSATPVWMHDIAAAIGLLTRLPVPVDPARAQERGAAAAWAYPLVGVLVGGLCLALLTLLVALGVPAFVAVAMVIAFGVIVTGAMHEDGLADSADGLWGGWIVARRLEIMKDSRIGVYGVCAIALTFLIRFACLSVIALQPLLALALIGGGALSRAAMVAVMTALPHARTGGLSQSVGRPPAATAWAAIAIALTSAVLIGLLVGHAGAALLMICAAGVAALACALIALRKIKGQTGDILGATQQVCELAMLIAVSAVAY